MPPIERISQKELARRLSLSQSTISRALAGSASIPLSTRELVKREAERLGYRPDPVLACLNTYRRTRQPISQGQSLAWLGTSPNPWEGGKLNYELALFGAAQRRSEKLGYSINYFWRHDPDLSLKRLQKIFLARGIAGLVIGPQTRPHTHIRLNIDNFSAVAIGRSLLSPAVDVVSTDHYQSMETCYRSLFRLGYRRIGFCIIRNFNERVGAIWMGSYLGQQVRRPSLVPIPAFLISSEGDSYDRFCEWFQKWKPDAIITLPDSWGCLPYLESMGIAIPQDLGTAFIAMPSMRPFLWHHSGIVEPRDELADLGIDVLVGRIRNNDKGIPVERRLHLLPGKWRASITTRPQQSTPGNA